MSINNLELLIGLKKKRFLSGNCSVWNSGLESYLCSVTQTAVLYFFFRLEISTVTPAHALNIDKEKYGIVMDMSHFDTGAQSLLVQATVNNYVVGWDLRMGKPAWELHNNVRTGLITTMAVHPTQSWLALGTSSGAHVCWDLRFQLQINNIQHPTGEL